jgi:hypothetical protein
VLSIPESDISTFVDKGLCPKCSCQFHGVTHTCQDYHFEIDSPLAIVWIDFKHPEESFDPIRRYRLNCMNHYSMFQRANYYHVRENGRRTEKEKAKFAKDFDSFYEANREKIESLARELAIDTVRELADLQIEIGDKIRFLQEANL